MAGWTIDDSEVRKLAVDFRGADARLARFAKPVINRAGLNIKNQMRADMAGHHRVASSIAYDILDDGYAVEIGPSSEGRSPGNIANIEYFGGAHGGGGTVADPETALRAEEPGFLRAMADALAQATLT